MKRAFVTTIATLSAPILSAAACELFVDPLDGSSGSAAWRRPPSSFVELEDGCRVLRYARDTTWDATTQPWVGDESWQAYRVEVEVKPEKMWSGIDVHVQDDGRGACEITVVEGPDDQLFVEASGIWDLASAWKLWPVGQRTIPHAPGSWVKLRLDVGADVVNVYADGSTSPYASFRDLPFTAGGIRLATYAGSGLFRNLRITRLAPEQVQLLLEDPWAAGRQAGVVRCWTVTPRYDVRELGAGIPPEILNDSTIWQEHATDDRGVVNLTPLVGPEAEPGVAFATTFLKAAQEGPHRVWLTYTDNLSLWCNRQLVFEGPPRQWFHPDREKYGSSRLIPDQFQVELPLVAGENELVVRTEVTEPTFGWGFWLRTAEGAALHTAPCQKGH